MRFRFTIRDLLWLTLVVAVAVGWWLDQKVLFIRADPGGAIWIAALLIFTAIGIPKVCSKNK